MRNIASMEPVSARELGLDPKRLDDLTQRIEQDISQHKYDGAAFIVARRGEIALQKAVGYSDAANDRQTRLDDVFHLMSLSKQLTTVVVLAVIERGDFSLTSRVCEFIPEFGVKGKHNITVEHLLTHKSGLNTELPLGLEPGGHMNIQAVVAAVSNERLFKRPGKQVIYNALTAHSILAEMVCRCDKAQRPFRQILREDLLEPLGMHNTSLSLRPELIARRVPVVPRMGKAGLFDPQMYEAMNQLITEESEFPAGGAIGSVGDVFRFTQMLRRGGELNGVRILSPAMVKSALTLRTGGQSNDVFDYLREIRHWPDWPAYIGLTFFLRGEGDFPTPMGLLASPETYSGQGAGSTLFWVDPVRDLSFVCLTAGIMEDGDNILRFQTLSDIVLSAVLD